MLPFHVLGNQSLSVLKAFLPCLFEFLPLGVLVVDASNRQVMLAGLSVLRMKFEEFLQRNQW